MLPTIALTLLLANSIPPTTCTVTSQNIEYARSARGPVEIGDKILCPYKELVPDEIDGWYQTIPEGKAIMLFTWAKKDGEVGWLLVPKRVCNLARTCAYRNRSEK